MPDDMAGKGVTPEQTARLNYMSAPQTIHDLNTPVNVVPGQTLDARKQQALQYMGAMQNMSDQPQKDQMFDAQAISDSVPRGSNEPMVPISHVMGMIDDEIQYWKKHKDESLSAEHVYRLQKKKDSFAKAVKEKSLSNIAKKHEQNKSDLNALKDKGIK